MNLKEILSVPGKKGLYRLVSRGNHNVIVESLQDGSRMPVFVSTQASALEDIRIFTQEGDIPLRDVFKRIYEIENGQMAIDPYASKSTDLEAYMKKIVPEYDRDKVYVSDMKKLCLWYNQLLANNILSFEENVVEEDIETEVEEEKKE